MPTEKNLHIVPGIDDAGYREAVRDYTEPMVIEELGANSYDADASAFLVLLDSVSMKIHLYDDGAGIVQSMEVLRILKDLNYSPKRTIRVVLFANEENGLRGGTKYAEEAKFNNEKHFFALESDAGGFTPRGFSFDTSDKEFKTIVDLDSEWNADDLP